MPFTITINAAATTALQIAANALAVGDSAAFGSGPSWKYADSVTWQTATIYHDPIREVVHAVGKVHSITDNEHYIYDEATNSWGGDTLSLSSGGHMWNTAFSPEHGEYYWIVAGTQDIQRYIPGSGWTTTPESGYSGGSGHAGMGWHPHLFGTDDGGVVVNAVTALVAWRRSTNSWVALQTGLGDPGYNGGSGAYNSVSGKLWVGTGNGSPGPARTRVVATGGGGTAGAVTSPGNPPLLIYGGGDGDSTNKVIPHPYTAGKLLLLASNSSAVYQSTNDGSSWSDAGYTHPFFIGGNNQWTCGPIPSYSVIYGLASRSSGWVRLWKPPA